MTTTFDDPRAVLEALDAGELVFYVQAWSSVAKTHCIGRGWVAARDLDDARRTANNPSTGSGRKLCGDFHFGVGHIKTVKRETHDGLFRACPQLKG